MSVLAQLDPENLANRVEILIERRQFGAVSKLIPAVAALAPRKPVAALLAARLAIAEGKVVEAAASLDNALATWPEENELLRLRARLALELGDPACAARHAADAIIRNRNDAEFKSILGRALLMLGQNVNARLCLEEAVAANPQDVLGVLALAEASPEQAGHLLASAATCMPRDASVYNRRLRFLIDKNETAAAADVALEAYNTVALDLTGYILSGHVAAMNGDWKQAQTLWHEVLRRAPQHPSAAYRLAAVRARKDDQLDLNIIAAADDARAELTELIALAGGTIFPGRARGAFLAANLTGRMLDLGCGTGLCAIAGRDLKNVAWDGVEASPRLAAIARDRSLYQTFSEIDPLVFLRGETHRWQGISFNFIAGFQQDLSSLFLNMAAHLLPGGVAVGAIVEAPVKGRFGPFCCFEHTSASIQVSAQEAGLSLRLSDTETLMVIDELALRGRIVALTAP